jgi:hypothetical protein
MQYYLPRIHALCTRTKVLLEEAKRARASVLVDIALVVKKVEELDEQFRQLQRSGDHQYSAEVRAIYSQVSFDHSSRCRNGV